jgi:hypothetical protein
MAFILNPSLAVFPVAFSLICLGACATQQDATRPKAPLNHTICDLNGIELIPAFDSTELIIFGEQHGTNEIPLFVAEIVCALSAAKEVNLLLELNADQQRELTRFLDSRGSDADKRRFIDAVFRTKVQQHDGRTSVAMFELIDQARQLRRKGRKISVIFFAPDPNEQNFDQSEYEVDMARNIRAAVRKDSNVKNIALVGNFHSRRISDVGGLKVVPAASLLSDLKVFSFVSSALAGEAWQCRQDGCGVQQLTGTTEPPKRGVRAFPTNMSGYDGVFSVGTPYTYSKPAE